MDPIPEFNAFIYLICEREFTKTKEDIYKIGKTARQDMARVLDYTKGSLLMYYCICNNSTVIERKIIEEFKTKFLQRKDIGLEYFEGNYCDMIDGINTIIKENGYGMNIHDKNKNYLEILKQKCCKIDENVSAVNNSNTVNDLEIINNTGFNENSSDDGNNNNENELQTIDVNSSLKNNKFFEWIVDLFKNSKLNNDTVLNLKNLFVVWIRKQNTALKYYNINVNKFTSLLNNNSKSRTNIPIKLGELEITTEYSIMKWNHDNIKKFIMDNTIITNDQIIVNNNQEINEVEDTETKIIKWFKTVYRLYDETIDKELPYIKLSIIYDNFINSNTYLNLNKNEQKNYKKNKFFDLIRSNPFIKKYYIENHNSLKYFIKGWCKN
jgi:hypothetical protein